MCLAVANEVQCVVFHNKARFGKHDLATAQGLMFQARPETHVGAPRWRTSYQRVSRRPPRKT
jgi:hypothetical protein